MSSWFNDGICDSGCNTANCQWDGMDCIQTCNIYDSSNNTCNYDLLFNNECDHSCNNTKCEYDLQSCVSNNDTCTAISTTTTTLSPYNMTSLTSTTSNNTIDNNGICYKSWIGDGWCDSDCNNNECNYDNSDCTDCSSAVSSNCYNAYEIIVRLVAAIYEPYELISSDEFCLYFDTLNNFITVNVDDNCTLSFQLYDLNQNGYLGLYEAVIATAEFSGLTSSYQWELRSNQIDCSLCLSNQSLYYW